MYTRIRACMHVYVVRGLAYACTSSNFWLPYPSNLRSSLSRCYDTDGADVVCTGSAWNKFIRQDILTIYWLFLWNSLREIESTRSFPIFLSLAFLVLFKFTVFISHFIFIALKEFSLEKKIIIMNDNVILQFSSVWLMFQVKWLSI